MGGDNMMRQEEERRREMMMRASNAMNREREANMNQGPGPNRGPSGGRPEDMMRGVGLKTKIAINIPKIAKNIYLFQDFLYI